MQLVLVLLAKSPKAMLPIGEHGRANSTKQLIPVFK